MQYIIIFNEFLWEYLGLAAICGVGMYLTIHTKCIQFKILWNFKKYLHNILDDDKTLKNKHHGISPIRLVFASTGSMIGTGNIVGIGAAIYIGGPGSILWIWIGAFGGMLLKYSEIYLGVKYRIQNNRGGYDGGPMYYLQAAFGIPMLGKIAAGLLCVYSIEIYQFAVILDRINLHIEHVVNKNITITLLIVSIIGVALGGIKRLANICSLMMPVFMIIYVALGLYIILSYYSELPSLLLQIFTSAFNGQAAIGGFVGSSAIRTASQGIQSGVYAGDIALGSDAVMHSETTVQDPGKQAILAIYTLFLDAALCTISALIIIVTNAWHNTNIDVVQSDVIPQIFMEYFPFGSYFMTFVLFVAGFTTTVAYLTIGFKTIGFLTKQYYAKILYLIIATISFFVFSYVSQEYARVVMTSCGGLLIILNISAIVMLHKNIKYEIL